MKLGELKITNIETIEEDINVINLSCNPYTYYMSNDILSHNCDTKYSIEKIDDTVQVVTLEEIVNTIVGYGCKHVAFTGGEPLLQIEKINEIIKLLSSHGDYTYHFETNGTIEPVYNFDVPVTYAISPKFYKLDPTTKNDYTNAIKQWTRWDYPRPDAFKVKTIFKFVYEGQETVDKIKQLEKTIDGFNRSPIYLMPEGRTLDLDKYRECSKICLREGWRFSIRLQCILWNDQRGT